MDFIAASDLQPIIIELEKSGLVTRTFRRLDPDRQAAVIEAVFDESIASGPQDLNIKKVAERAGVAVGSLYQYFGSRQGLLEFALELTVQLTQAQFDQYKSYLGQMPLREALQAYSSGALEWAQQYTGGFSRLMARAAYEGDSDLSQRMVRPIAGSMLGMVREIVLAAQARGELRPGIDLEATVHALHAFIIALYDPLLLPYLNHYFRIGDTDLPPERTIGAAIDMILRGITNDTYQNQAKG